MGEQDTAGHAGPGTGPGPRRLRSSPTLAPVAQRIEHRPPEPVAQVRVLPGAPLPGALSHCRGRQSTQCGERGATTGKRTGTAAHRPPGAGSAGRHPRNEGTRGRGKGGGPCGRGLGKRSAAGGTFVVANLPAPRNAVLLPPLPAFGGRGAYLDPAQSSDALGMMVLWPTAICPSRLSWRTSLPT
jgi:hypothetical protein